MGELAPAGPVYQAGTLSGNPLATAAGLAVLGEVAPADYEALGGRAAVFAKDLESVLGAAGLAVSVPTVGPLVGLFVGPGGRGTDRPADRLRGRAGARRPTAPTGASSTPCSGGAWRSPPAPTR